MSRLPMGETSPANSRARQMGRHEANADMARQSRFETIYQTGLWQHNNRSVPLSGTGSTPERTVNVRAAILSLLLSLNVSSILDAPCGDLSWMRLMLPDFATHRISYTGVDIVRPLIRSLQAEFKKKPLSVSFHGEPSELELPVVYIQLTCEPESHS